MKDKKRIKTLGKIALATTMAFSTTSTLMPALPIAAQENVGQETKITRSEIVSAVAKSQMSGQNIEMSLDGDPSTYTDSNYNDAQGTGALPQIYTFTLNEVKELSRVRILPRPISSNGRITQYSIAVGVDASSLQTVVSGAADPTSEAWIEIPFTPTQGQVVQMTLYSDFAANVVTTAEVEMYAIPQSTVETDNKESLKQKIDQALSLQAGSYSSSSWQNLSAALSEAQSVYENEEAQEATISEIEEILTLALNGLYTKDSASTVNKDALSARIDEANAIIISSYRIPDLFPADQVTALKEIVANAESVLQDASATQESVNQAADQVNQGMGFEEEQEGTVTVRIAGTKDGTGSEEVYSVDSFEEAIQQAIDEGKITNENFVTSIVFEKGVVTDDDLRYISKEIAPKKLQTFSLNLSNTLVYQDDGEATTVFPASTFKSFSGLENVSLAGWTELDEQAFYGCDSLTTISIPDVTVLHYNALAHSGLQSIELPSVTRIEEGAFSSCDKLTSISMPKVQEIIDAPFYGCRKLTEIRIPSTIQTLDSTRFGYYADEKVHVIFEGNTAPSMTGKIVDPSYSGGDGVLVTIPYEGLNSYLNDVDTSGLLTTENLPSWLNGSEFSVDGAYTITYKVEGQEDQFAYVPADQSIGQTRMPTVEAPEGKELKEWNTKADGSGDSLNQDSILTSDVIVYPIFTEAAENIVQVTLYAGDASGTYQAESLEDAVSQMIEAGLIKNKNYITGVDIQSGTITEQDIDYIQNFLPKGKITQFSMNLDGDLVYEENGEVSTSLPAHTFDGYTELVTLSLNGWTTIEEYALSGTVRLKEVHLDNVERIEDFGLEKMGGLSGYEGITKLELPSLKYMGTKAVSNAFSLQEVYMPVIEEVKEQPFFNCSKLESVTVSPTYLGDVDRVFTQDDLPEWLNEGTKLFVEGTYKITYTMSDQTEQFAYVPKGEAIGENRLADGSVSDKVFQGWNLASDGSKENIDQDTILTDNVIVYPIFEEAVANIDVTLTGTKSKEPTSGNYKAESIEDAVNQMVEEGLILNANFITGITVNSGTITDDDLRYIKNELSKKSNTVVDGLQTLILDLGENVAYVDDEEPSTVLPEGAFKDFSALTTVSLKGWTVLSEQALYGTDSLTNLNIPNVQRIERNALFETGLTELNAPAATYIGDAAIKNAENLTTINIPKMETMEDAPFYGCTKLETINIPATVKTLTSTRFGYVGPETLNVIFEGEAAPTMTNTIIDPYQDNKIIVTIPVGGLNSYFGNEAAQGILTKEQLPSWLNGAELKVNGANTITYKVEGQEDQFAYIPSEETIGEKRMLTVEAPEGKEFKGWNTAADGTGTTITTESKLTEDTVVYPIFASTVDKSELQKLYDEVKDTQSDVNSFKYFTTSLNKAKTVLEDANATQDEVDKAKVDLEARYYAVKVQELNEIYNPENEFNFMDYTTESLVPVINMWGITHNRTNGNYQENEAKGNIGQMKGWYEEYLKAIEDLQKAGEDAAYIGITNESSKTNKEQGSFEVVSAERVYVDGEEKVKLVVNFNNTGIHPIYGEELPNANGATEFKKLGSLNDKTSFRYQGYGADGKHMISAGMDEKTKLPEASNWYSGVQGVCYIDPDINYVTFSVDNEIYSSWIYRIPELPEPADTIAPEVTVTTSNNGQPTNQSVKVTITANEAIQDIEGWTRVNETTLEKVYDANTSENVIVTDTAGNTTKTSVVVEGIDKAAPKTDVTYETTEDGVLVTIKADEAIQDVEGWTKVDDQTLQKLFNENGTEEVIVQDAVGNQTMVTVTVDSIDKESPIVKVEYETTPEGVQVTITANEPIQTPDGWTKVSDTVFTKLYTENTEEKITIYDLSGNSTDITIFVTGIGSETGEETNPGEEGKPGDSEKPETEDTEKTDGEDTATNMYAGIFGGLMAAAVAGFGVLGLLKRKKK